MKWQVSERSSFSSLSLKRSSRLLKKGKTNGKNQGEKTVTDERARHQTASFAKPLSRRDRVVGWRMYGSTQEKRVKGKSEGGNKKKEETVAERGGAATAKRAPAGCLQMFLHYAKSYGGGEQGGPTKRKKERRTW